MLTCESFYSKISVLNTVMVMAKINANTNVLMDGAVKVYRRPNTKKWQTNFQIAGHWIRLSTGKFDLEEAKAAAREH